jgi:polysaccharide export outer membrane protein
MKLINFPSVCFAVVLFNGLLMGNVFGQKTEPAQPIENKTVDKLDETGDASADNPNAAKQKTNEKYRIGFQDTLEIQVFRHPELSQVVNVSPDGTILMPRIDKPIVAVCKTERELGETVGTLYKNYLRNPFVNVRAVEQRSQPFAVIGAVEKPGSFYLNRRIRLLELLAFAGGPKTDKAGAKIQVARVGNIAGCADNSEDRKTQVEFLAFKTNDVMSGKDNPEMQPGDIVSVLEAEEAFIVGNVNKPTTISLREPITLTQAIAKAEGLDDTAKTDKIIIQRQASGNQPKTELAYNLKDIREKKIPDPILQANDIIEVSNDKNKSLKKDIFGLFKSIIPTAAYRLP